jgi:hypothetical protein
MAVEKLVPITSAASDSDALDMSPPGMQRQSALLQELGVTGLRFFSGYIAEEFMAKLQGERGRRMFREMADNHPMLSAILLAISLLIRRTDWSVEAASASSEDQANAEFIQSCMDDMEHTWDEFLSEALSMLNYGFAFHEVVYKVRRDRYAKDPAYRSRYTDQRIGWRKLPLRSQDSLQNWLLSPEGDILGYVQMAPNGGGLYTIPMSRGLLFRTISRKNNPEGLSLLRGCVTSYLTQRHIQFLESVGLERDMAGFPVIYAPANIMKKTATQDDKATYAALKTVLKNMRRDENEGLILPSDCFPGTTNRLYELKLVSTGGSRTFDTTEIMQRYDTRMCQSLLADFLMLGQTQVGTQSLGESKIDLFVESITAILDSIADIFNRGPIPELLYLNGETPEETPKLKPGKVNKRDVAQIADIVSKLAGAGMPMFPDPALEEHIRKEAGFPMTDAGQLRTAGEGAGQSDTPGQAPAPTEKEIEDGNEG